eukprot:614203-Prorocentrum_minimum.AAC.1
MGTGSGGVAGAARAPACAPRQWKRCRRNTPFSISHRSCTTPFGISRRSQSADNPTVRTNCVSKPKVGSAQDALAPQVNLVEVLQRLRVEVLQRLTSQSLHTPQCASASFASFHSCEAFRSAAIASRATRGCEKRNPGHTSSGAGFQTRSKIRGGIWGDGADLTMLVTCITRHITITSF